VPNRYQWAIIIFLFPIMLAACVGTKSDTTRSGPSPPLSAQDYAAETKRLQEALNNAANSADKAATHRALAWLYIAHNNPRRDYDKALVHLVQYGRLDPQGASDMRVRDWVTVLDTVKSSAQSSGQQQTIMQATIDQQQIQLDQLRQQVRQSGTELSQADERTNELRQRQRAQQKKIASLETENQKLRDTIEKLKTLDLFLEQKERELKYPPTD
jgi:hypothetical protein